MKDMLRGTWKCAWPILIGIILVACGPAQKAEPEPFADAQDPMVASEDAGADVIEDAQDLIVALEDAGADVAQTTIATDPILPATGQVLFVNSIAIQVYEFPSPDSRERTSLRIEEGEELFPVNAANGAEGSPIVWANERLLVVYDGKEGSLIMLLDALLGEPLNLPEPEPDEPYPPAVPSAMQFLADELGITPSDISVVSYEEVEWSDACLGYSQPREMCAQVITPGWLIKLHHQDQEYELHTDAFGDQVRGP